MEKRHTLNYEDDNHDALKKKKKKDDNHASLKKKKKDDNHDIRGKKETKKMQADKLAGKHVFNI